MVPGMQVVILISFSDDTYTTIVVPYVFLHSFCLNVENNESEAEDVSKPLTAPSKCESAPINNEN